MSSTSSNRAKTPAPTEPAPVLTIPAPFDAQQLAQAIGQATGMALAQVLGQTQERERERSVIAASTLSATGNDAEAVKAMKTISATSPPPDLFNMVRAVYNALHAQTDTTARRAKLRALGVGADLPQHAIRLIESITPEMLAHAAAPLPDAEWRLVLIQALTDDLPNVNWWAVPQTHEQLGDFIHRSHFFDTLRLVQAAMLIGKPAGANTTNAVRQTVAALALDRLAAAIPRDPALAPLRAALQAGDTEAALTILAQPQWATVRLVAPQLWRSKATTTTASTTTTKENKPSKSQAYALASNASAAIGGTPLARRPISVGHHGSPLEWHHSYWDTCGSHNLISDDLLASLPGSPTPAVHAPPITSTTLADGTCVKHKRPLKAYLLDVTCAALGGQAHTLTVYASSSTAFPLIIGTPGMSQLGVQITCDDPSVSPHVAIGRELIAPTPDLTTAAATEAAATPAPPPTPSASLPAGADEVLLMFDDLAVSLYGHGLTTADGILLLTDEQLQAARTLADAALRGECASETGVNATSCLFSPSLTAPGFDAGVDRTPPVPSDEPSKYKFATGTAKFFSIVDDHPTMPAADKAYLKQRTLDSGVQLISSEAPLERFGPVCGPHATYLMRIKPGANLNNMAQSYRPMSKDKYKALMEQRDLWLKLGVIEPVKPGESRIVSQPVVVNKVDQDNKVVGHRVAIDLRLVNRALEEDHYSPMPMAEMLRWAVQDAWRLTIIDMKALFNQFEIAPHQRHLCTVMLGPGRYYRFVGAPFGLKSILAWTQRFMDATFASDDVKTYVDDSPIKHRIADDYRAACSQVGDFFDKAAAVHMAVNVDKLQLITDEPHLLGHDLDLAHESFTPRRQRIDALLHWEKPTTNERLRSFLSHAAPWASHMPGWQLIAPRLQALIRDGQPLTWTADGDDAFQLARFLFSDVRPKHLLADHGDVSLYSDGDRAGVGWVVTQKRPDGKEVLIDAGGRATANYEKRLDTPELEILGAREALRSAGHYLVERSHFKCTWKSDSQAAFKIIQQRALPKSDAVRRFVLEMSQLNDIEMVHIPGWHNPADPIARQWQLSGNQLRVPLANARMALDGLASTSATPTTAAATMATRTDDTAPTEPTSPATPVTDPTPPPATPDLMPLSPPPPAPDMQHDDDDTSDPLPEPPTGSGDAHAPASPADHQPVLPTTDTVAHDTATDHNTLTPEQLDAVARALEADPHTARSVHDQRVYHGIQTVAADDPTARALRRVATGQFDRRKDIVALRPRRDRYGRIYVTVGGKDVLYVPVSMIEQVMWSIHTSPANGGAHRAAHSLLQVFNSRFFTPEAKRHAERIVHDCPVCQQTRARAPDGLLGTDDRAKRRFGIIHIDVMELNGPVRYALVIVDRVTGAVEAVPIAERNAEHAAVALRDHWLLRYGTPDIVVPDQAQELIGDTMHTLARDYGFAIDPTPSRTAQANGLVERAIQQLKKALRALTPLGGDWRDALPMARYSIMAAVSGTRGFSPNELVLGEAPRLAVDQLAAADVPATPPTLPQPALHAKIARNTADANANRAASHAKDAQRARDAAGGKPLSIAVNDVVWLENTGAAHDNKFDNRFRRTGPYSVARVDKQRLKVKLVRWDTRAPERGWTSLHRLTKAVGWETKPTTPAEEDAALNATTPGQKHTTPGLQSPIRLQTDYGVITDIIQSAEHGTIVLLEVETNGVATLQSEHASKFSRDVITEAMRLKRQHNMPRSLRKALDANAADKANTSAQAHTDKQQQRDDATARTDTKSRRAKSSRTR
jgi:hypothetical protein